ncbi:hypothetical protein LXL04_012608 [Taraxacum kok-saghyz]
MHKWKVRKPTNLSKEATLTKPFLFSGLSIHLAYSLYKSAYLNLVSLYLPAMFFDSDHRLSFLKFM